MADNTRTDPTTLLAALTERKVTVELGTMDLCFMALLHLRAQAGLLASFQEEHLIDAFEELCERTEPGLDQRRKRATHAIQRLRDQRMLARVDGAGLVRSGEYALTRLASGIVEFFLNDETLTRESLTLLTSTLLKSLEEIREAALRSASPESWQIRVKGPLEVIVGELAAGIERRQRGLDLQQEKLKKHVAELLAADWFGAIARCQSLLDETSATLRELNEVLLSDAHRLQALLQDIEDAAAASGQDEAEVAARRALEQIDRIGAWGSARQRAFSEYYQYVHRYLRDVVRLDPSRALSERLRDQMAGKNTRAFSLTVARAPSIELLRDVVEKPERPPVKRPRSEREDAPELTPAEDPRLLLEGQVRAALETGAARLTEVTELVTRDVHGGERFVTAGRVAEIVARVAEPRAELERPWLPIRSDLLIEEWQVTNRRTKDD